MATHNLSASATDSMGASGAANAVATSTAPGAVRVVKRSLWENRICWGSAIDASIEGPFFTDDVADGFNINSLPATLAQLFWLDRDVRFTGCRIYKAPNAVGSNIPVSLYEVTGYNTQGAVDTTTLLASTTIPSWVADDGGWQQVDFPAPVALSAGTEYIVSYFSADGIYAYSPWVYNAQDTCVWPLLVRGLFETASTGRIRGTVFDILAGVDAPPRTHSPNNYYVDPQIEWDDPRPGYDGGTDYYDLFSHPVSRHDFPVGVYYSDPPFLGAYYALGVNLQIAGDPANGGNAQEYIDAMNAIGNAMDWFPYRSALNTGLHDVQTDYPGIEAQVCGYQLDDEPDMSNPYRSPELLKSWRDYIRQRDSRKPIYLTFGRWAIQNQTFAWSPTGASALTVNRLWREWAELADIISCDLYSLTADIDPERRWGVWAYAAQVGRMREISDDRKPIWLTIETTSQTPNEPIPSDVEKACWAALIAGARGIVFFDHRFGDANVTQDFAAMINDPAMSAMVSNFSALCQSLGEALISPDLGLVTEWTTSNKTEGPKGGTFGVPIHFTTRADADYEYCFAQAIRPGATTGTLTIPTWAGETVEVLEESRSVVLDAGGVLTDSFAADYEFHLYRRSLV